MIEMEWLTCVDSEEMLNYIWRGCDPTGLTAPPYKSIKSDRKLDLFNDACSTRNIGVLNEFRCVFLREIYGNPFQPIKLLNSWITSNVLDIARMIYEEHKFEYIPILSDALLEAGCDDESILEHCRGQERYGRCLIPLRGPHVRGCWVLDLLLEKQ